MATPFFGLTAEQQRDYARKASAVVAAEIEIARVGNRNNSRHRHENLSGRKQRQPNQEENDGPSPA